MDFIQLLEEDPLKYLPELCCMQATNETIKWLDHCQAYGKCFYEPYIIAAKFIAINRNANHRFLQHILNQSTQLDKFFSALREAVSNDNFIATKQLLDAGVKQFNANLRLNALCYVKSEQMFQLLLDYGADVNGFHMHFSVLTHFIQKNCSQFSLKLIELGAEIKPYDAFMALKYCDNSELHRKVLPAAKKSSFRGYTIYEYACRCKRADAILSSLDKCDVTLAEQSMHWIFTRPGDKDVRPVIRKLLPYLSSSRAKISLLAACRNSLTSSVIELIRLGVPFDQQSMTENFSEDIRKILDVNFSSKCIRTLNDTRILRPQLHLPIITVMTCRLSNFLLQLLPIEILEQVFSYL